MQMTCRVEREIDGRDVLCHLTGQGEWCDYGVRGSPRWIEVDSAEIAWGVEVDGVDYATEQELEAAHPGLAAAIRDWACENADWEQE
jgi:hypothetical protein